MIRRFVVSSVLLAASCTAPAQTSYRPYTQLYVFGDSYSDMGAGFVFTNGPTAVARLAERLNIPFTYYGAADSKGKGLNFAVSAAKTGSDAGEREPPNVLFRLGMKNQVQEFAALLKSGEVKFDPAITLFFLAGGLNDHGTPQGYTRTNEEAEIDTLYSLGARRFMVALLPTQIAGFASTGMELNPEIARIPAEERAKHPDIRIALSGWGPFFDQVITHPAQYGLTDTTSVCAEGLSLTPDTAPHCDSPANHFYFYKSHPSAAAHRAVGDLLYNEALTKAP